MSGRAPLLVPATPRQRLRAEDIRPVTPWFARSGAVTGTGAPALVNFSEDTFVEALFAAIDATGDAFDPQHWPKRLAYRDYAEVPRACKDSTGAPRYDTAKVARAPVTRDLAENPVDPTAADPVAAAETAEWSRDPDAGRRAAPLPWLRKLYLPNHEQFPVVAAELVCDRFGWLPVDKPRVVEVGMVVRRLVRDVATGERWQDWVVGSEGKGAWVELADEAMQRNGKRVDPASVTLPATIDEAALRTHIGLSAKKPLTLDLQPMGPVPGDVGAGAGHTGYFGLLSLMTSETESVGEPDDPARYAAIATELGAAAKSTLEKEVGSQATTLSAQIASGVAALAGALLPASGVTDVAAALASAATDAGFVYIVNSLPSFGYSTAAHRAVVLGQVVDELLGPLWKALWDKADRGVPSPDSPAGWFNAAYAVAVAGYSSTASGREGAWREWIVATHSSTFADAVLARLRSQIRADVDPRQPWSGASLDTAIAMAALTRRLRGYRLVLLDSIYAAEMPPGGYDPTILDRKRSDGTPVVTTASPGAEISAWLDAVNDPGSAVPPLSPLPTTTAFTTRVDAHRIGGQLERMLFEIERACLPAGSAFGAMVEERVKAAETALDTRLGTTTKLRAAGVDVGEQPLRGLLVFPTWNPAFPVGSTNVIGEMAAQVATRWGALAPTTSTPASDPFAWEPLKKTVRARRTTRLARFDSDNLYAVWVFSRVKPKDPCLPDLVSWSARTEPFSIAEPLDLLGLRPVNVRLPDLQNLMKDLPRLDKAKALPFAAVSSGPGCGITMGEEPADTARDCGIAMICSFGIPVFTICAWIMFSIIFNILLILPGFAWMLLLKFCLPIPRVQR